jgi:tetratricopeptide (TPR) repeat protein
MKTVRFSRFAISFALASCLLPLAASADTGGASGRPTLSGSYLAARSAQTTEDMKAAAGFFESALAHDPTNALLVERVLILQLANGRFDSAKDLADRLVSLDVRNPVARLVRAVAAVNAGEFTTVQSELTQAAQTPLAVLSGGLVSAWAGEAIGKVDDSLKAIAALNGPTWYAIFKDYHTAVMADLGGRKDLAVESISKAFEGENPTVRIADAYGRILARAGKRDQAIAGLATYLAEQPNQAVVVDLLASLKGGITPPPIVANAREGVAEVLFGLGAAIGTDQGTELPAAYLQLARTLLPDSDLTLMALGDLFLVSEHCPDAIEIYGQVPESSRFRRNADIQTGLCLDSLDRTDEGAAHIRKVVDAEPSDLEAIIALGNIYRGRDRFAEAAEIYTLGINTITRPTPADWRIFYFRGVALERSKQWTQAEADLKKALELNPEQPQVLNYLGYSWVDLGQNLDEGLRMIQGAVDQRPNDGYIVDSLGWAYYRLGRYEESVEQLERAVELKPDDPVINDHLGDAYWKVGRKLEATFQWSHARDLDPEPADLEKIVKKLQSGMTANAGSGG